MGTIAMFIVGGALAVVFNINEEDAILIHKEN